MRTKPKQYIIIGDPVPLARVRIGNRRCWDSQKALKLEYELQLQQQHGSLPLYSGPLSLDVLFYMPIPQKMIKKKKEMLVDNYHISRPDTSNLLKLIEDIGTGVLYRDDALIAQVHAQKIYSYEPRTVFTITELKKEKKDT